MFDSFLNILKHTNNNNSDFKDYLLIKQFIIPYYQQINIARLQHLESLNLDLQNKKVIEFGAGIGDHTLFYLYKNCTVLPTDGRGVLVEYISKRLGIKAMKLDIEKDINKIKKLPRYDIIHCYGILYHLSNPLEFLKSIKNIGNILLLETCVSAGNKDKLFYKKEFSLNPTQAMRNIGCRPTRSWVFNRLKNIFKYVYLPITQPKHNQFPLLWKNLKLNDSNQLVRSIFIASHKPINSRLLTTKLIDRYKQW